MGAGKASTLHISHERMLLRRAQGQIGQFWACLWRRTTTSAAAPNGGYLKPISEKSRSEGGFAS
jgi:hypothetical protein